MSETTGPKPNSAPAERASMIRYFEATVPATITVRVFENDLTIDDDAPTIEAALAQYLAEIVTDEYALMRERHGIDLDYHHVEVTDCQHWDKPFVLRDVRRTFPPLLLKYETITYPWGTSSHWAGRFAEPETPSATQSANVTSEVRDAH